MNQNPEQILQRLEELRQWQEEQRQKQVTQRDLLNQEQTKLYEMFGISINNSTTTTTATETSCDSTLQDEQNHLHPGLLKEILSEMTSTTNLSPITTSLSQQIPVQNTGSILKSGRSAQSISDSGGNRILNVPNNLPAPDRRSIVQFSNQQQEQKSVTNGKHVEKENQFVDEVGQAPKKFLRRGEGLQQRFGVDPDSLRLNNLPKYKFAGAHRKSKFFRNAVKKIVLKQSTNTERINDGCDQEDEERDGEDKSDELALRKNEEEPVVSQKQIEIERIRQKTEKNSVEQDQTVKNVIKQSNREPVKWGLYLERAPKGSISIQDTPTREIIRQQQRELDELNVFEDLEARMASNNNSNFQSSLANNLNTGDSSSNPSPEPQPLVNDPDEPTVEKQQAPGRVRFMSQVGINETTDISDSETVVSEMELLQFENTSTPNTRPTFQTFKKNLLGIHFTHQPTRETSTIQSQLIRGNPTDCHSNKSSMEFIHEQSEQMKTKLSELEREIELFRTNNASLTKAKQQMELDRIQMGEERIEIEERLNDERIKMEVYLHDERMKLLSEKEALDRRSKELRGPNRKEREETTALRNQVAALETDLATKEQRHVAAQARLRAQLRTMEKDLKDFSYEIESMKKENKKLEAENVRLRRQSNNKMLSEINRNIAKLSEGNNNVVATSNNSSNSDKTDDRNKSSSSVGHRSIIQKERSQSEPRSRSKSEPRNSVVVVEDKSDCSSEDEPEPHLDNASKYFNQTNNNNNNNRHAASASEKSILDPIQRSTSTEEQFQILPDTQDQQQNCKREILNADGSKDILYPNGNIKKISKDTMRIRMLYYNKDIKETNINEGTVKYYYASTNTWHTTYLDGLEILEFPNGQTEHRFKDGRVEVHFPTGAIRITDVNQADLLEEWRYPDGTQVVQKRNGEKILSLPNGQREIHNELHKRREYPDGTVKLVYPDGSQETRYSNGRVRLKDATGKLVMDSETMLSNAQQQ